jgi:hypothetical protein
MLLAKRAIPAAVMISGVLFAWKGARIHDCRTRYHQAGAEISILQGELEYYRRENGHYPTTGHRLALSPLGKEADIDPGFALPPVPDMELPRDTGFVLPSAPEVRLPRDPWGNFYFYKSDGKKYVLGSFGPSSRCDSAGKPDLIVQSPTHAK